MADGGLFTDPSAAPEETPLPTSTNELENTQEMQDVLFIEFFAGRGGSVRCRGEGRSEL